MLRFATVVSVAVLLVTGLPVFTAPTFAQSEPSQAETVWVFKEVSPNTSPARPGETVTRSQTGVTRRVTVEPAAEFNNSFPEMMIASAPAGFRHEFTVNVQGRIAPGADTDVQGFRVNDAILIISGRWPSSRPAVGVGVNCVTDIFGAPLGCTPEAGTFAEASGTFTVSFPWSVPEDGLFKFGVGALNCPECFVEYVYEATTVEPARCGGKAATIGPENRDSDGRIVGTRGADVIVGTSGPDIINGRGGKDIICGKGGADVIRGGSGADRIFGGKGADAIRAGKGDDSVEGGGGQDEIWGGRGDDNLKGGRGDDIIHGDSGDDTARGGPGTDECAAEREISCEKDPEIPGPQVKWKMVDRYGFESLNGIVEPTEVLDPARFTVEFTLRHGDGSRCSSEDKVKAKSRRGKFRTPDADKPCKIEGRFPEDTHLVKFTLTTDEGKGKTFTEVVVQDWLIVGIGDSNGSGEGVPDRPGGARAGWVLRRCHRSANSYQALAAARLEKTDPQTSVTFQHLSCSGAQIETGLLEPYRGIVGYKGKEDLPAQLDTLDTTAAHREVDAVIISAGVNDLNFGAMVEFCIIYERCPDRKWERSNDETLRERMVRKLARLPGLYSQLNDRLENAEIPADRVYITEYFDSTKDENGVVCDPLIEVAVGRIRRHFTQAEATWAADDVLHPLNAQVRAAADLYGWNMVSGAEEHFVPHGYCAEPPKEKPKKQQSWIVTREQSNENQGDNQGTLHSNRKGHNFQRNRVVQMVRDDFYDLHDNPRRPR